MNEKTNTAKRIEHDENESERALESETRRKQRATNRDASDSSIAQAFLSDGCGPNFL